MINQEILYEHMMNIFKETNISVSELSEKVNVGENTINNWIKNKTVPVIHFNTLNGIMEYPGELSEMEKIKLFDMFYTPANEAKRLTNIAFNFISENWDIDLCRYNFLEPSVGDGAFYDAIEYKSKIGVDIHTNDERFIQADFMEFDPKTNMFITIGNPPFGQRGALALKFINHASKFSDFICMILPPVFASSANNSPRFRINKEFYLAKEIKLLGTNYRLPNGKTHNVNGVFQIWTKLKTPSVTPITPRKPLNKTKELVNIFCLNKNTGYLKILSCKLFMPDSSFKKLFISDNFEDIPRKGYGIEILKDHDKIYKILKKIDWQEKSFLSTNSANCLRKDLILLALEDELAKEDEYDKARNAW